jgi:hypothetical protein
VDGVLNVLGPVTVPTTVSARVKLSSTIIEYCAFATPGNNKTSTESRSSNISSLVIINIPPKKSRKNRIRIDADVIADRWIIALAYQLKAPSVIFFLHAVVILPWMWHAILMVSWHELC